MKIIGINHDMFISSAALIIDGKIVSAVAEERLTREKMTRSFPHNAIRYCLKKANLSLNQIDYIANSYNPSVHFKKFHPIFSNHRRFRGDYFYSIPDNLIDKISTDNSESEYTKQEIQLSKNKLKVFYINHHLSHAANGFYLSPFKKSAVLTADGAGEDDTVNFLLGENNNLTLLNRIKIPHSTGSFYSTFTEYLGYKPENDEWKVMALSSYGSKKNKFYKLIKKMVSFNNDGTFNLDQNYFKQNIFILPNLYTEKFVKTLGPARKKEEKFTQRHYEIASAMQEIFEEIMFHMLKNLYSRTKSQNVVLSGGSFMNSVLNGKVRDNTPFKNVWVSSCPDDSGQSIGSALYLYNNILKNKKRYELKHNFFGPSYKNDEIKSVLNKFKINYTYDKNISKIISNHIAKGKLIGWFQGEMEFGQRSLGNRSIVADPRYNISKEKVNSAVKYRESYRPFAPSVLKEECSNYFEMKKNDEIQFMEKVVRVRKDKKHLIKAVVHKDLSARVQTVDKVSNPKFYDLIKEFKNLTGIPCLLNTSFNVNGEPIVCSPEDAIKTFYSCGLDILVMGNYIVQK